MRSPLPLPCRETSRGASADVELVAGGARFFRTLRAECPNRDRRRWFTCQTRADGSTYLCWRALFEFLVLPDGRRIVFRRLSRATNASFGAYLLGQVLSFSLIARRIEALHGTVLAIDGKGVALVGDCGYGKSTLGAALLARGFPLVTDDVIVLQNAADGWLVQPGAPRVKLFPSVANAVLGRRERGVRMHRETAKLILPLGATEAAATAVPLARIYVLSPPRKAKRRPVRPRLTRLSECEALLEIVRAAFNLLVVSRHRLESQFEFSTRVARAIPISRLDYPRRLADLPAVCNLLLSDVAAARGSGRAMREKMPGQAEAAATA